MLKKISKFFLFSVLFLLLALPVKAYFNPGSPAGFVNDYTGTLSSEQKQSLENKLTQFEKDTSNEISVVMIKTLEGDTIEGFAVDLFKEWGIGKKGKDNGILILVAKDDRKMRIEVGYGLEGALTDAQSNWIINSIMKPAFRADDFYKGIDGAVDKVISATKGEYVPSSKQNSSKKSGINFEMIFWIGAFILMWLASVLGRSKSWWLGGVIGGVAGIVIGLIKGFMLFGFIAIAILVPAGLLFDFIVSKNYNTAKSRGHIPWWIGGGGFGGGKGGGFGGFGGGMSGGGGSSGSW